MLNQIKLENNSILIDYKKYGRNSLFYFSAGEIFNSSALRKNKIFIKCAGLGIWFGRPYGSSFLHTKWYSRKWHSLTNNPFKGKSHSEETKKKISEKSGRSSIENRFYGRSHSI